MPGGSHRILASHDPLLLRKSVKITAVRLAKRKVRFQITSLNVGHNFPTGDVFRTITLEVSTKEDGAFTKIATFGRNFKTKKTDGGDVYLEIIRNSSIEPLKPTVLTLEAPAQAKYFRLVYHYRLNAFHVLPDGEGVPVVVASGRF
jgi:hypothetical protein